MTNITTTHRSILDGLECTCGSPCIHFGSVYVSTVGDSGGYGFPATRLAPDGTAHLEYLPEELDVALRGNNGERCPYQAIRGWCEMCSQTVFLVIRNHEGTTLLDLVCTFATNRDFLMASEDGEPHRPSPEDLL